MRKLVMMLGAATMAIPATMMVPTVGASAQSRYSDSRHYDSRHDSRSGEWRDSRGRLRCRKSDGTTGLVVGGVAGALLGRTIDTRGDRTLGTLGGAAAGALAGRAIDRSGSDHGRRCR